MYQQLLSVLTDIMWFVTGGKPRIYNVIILININFHDLFVTVKKENREQFYDYISPIVFIEICMYIGVRVRFKALYCLYILYKSIRHD